MLTTITKPKITSQNQAHWNALQRAQKAWQEAKDIERVLWFKLKLTSKNWSIEK